MKECGDEFHSCRCCLLAGHEETMPHVCRCGGAWDEDGLAVRWPRPEVMERRTALMQVPMPAPGASWRFHKETIRFERVGKEG